MKHFATLILVLFLFARAHAQNTCATAVPITAGTYTVALIDGFEIPYPVCIAGGALATNGEWYMYTALADTSLTITTDLPVNVGGDTRFHVYTGGCSALACVAGDDDSGSGLLSKVTLNVTEGTTYWIAFDDRWSAAGFDFQLIEHAIANNAINFTQVTTTANSDCIVDMNGDHLDDIVSVPDASTITVREQQIGGTFTTVSYTTTPADNTPSWSICAGDLDNNGYNDLMYGGGGGATFMMADATGSAYTEVSFAQYIFCQRTNMVDINSDGALDAFSCHDVDANVYFLNDGSGNLTFNQGGLGETCGNYGSIWVDFDNDGDMDLFVAKCGCDPVDIMYQNNGDGTFTNIAAAMGFNNSQQSWSSAWGDYDNDGDMDVLVGTSSGDFQQLMRNDGGSWSNVTAGSGFDTFSGASIEWTTHDFNNDGYLDILGGGSLLVNNGDMTFSQVVTPTPGNGPVGDLNNDGFLDVLNWNTIWYNTPNGNHWLTVNTVGTVSNYNGIGARVKLITAAGTQIREVRSGDGFATMSSLNAHFGLGGTAAIEQLEVHWPSGIVDVVAAPAVNTVVTVVEGSSPEGIEENVATGVGVYPDPTADVLNISGQDLVNAEASVYGTNGRIAMQQRLHNGQLDVRALAPGAYVLKLTTGNGAHVARFTKQ